ncbi:MAG: SDR family oxidoreductase [Devosia nanyangense]|uniref:SDR family oxidoreductase n=1 Tax=Devosia nanyangense TaxID=1228055 RepID=A0A933L3G4_9HYPH|nr:SDR family oxidoreductase [Devosia nanyangense]
MARNGVLVVTGGSRGIGAATSLLAAERGWAVVVNYAGNVAAAEAVVSHIRKAGGEAIAVRGDVSQPEDVEHIFAAADRIGVLTGLVNNAGIILPAQRVDEMNAERLARGFAVNVTGSFLCAGAAVRRMSSKFGGKGGAIVNLSSGASKLGGANVYVDYAASKGAIDSFTVGLALEVAGDGIRVNAVRPGVIDTEIHASTGDPGRVQRMAASLPMARAGTAQEVARAVLWLLSDEASYSTGTTITVSGGRAIVP